jgi:MFS family permease
MVAVSAVVGMGYTILSTLAPTYVNDVLDTDPANTVYVMGIAGVGMTLSLFAVPALIKKFGERWVAAVGFLMLGAGLVGLGLIQRGAVDFLTPINPFHWVNNWFDFINLSEKVELAMLLAFPVGMGAGLTDNSVKTYLNRRVPVPYQGRTFATRNLTESALTIPPLLGVSALAAWIGISAVLFIMPVVFYGIVVALLRISAQLAGDEEEVREGVLRTYWEASETEEITSMDEDEGVAEPTAP